VIDKLSLRNFRRVVDNPAYLRGAANELGTDIDAAIHRRFYDKTGVQVMDEDWDVLLLLDGCRYDMFAERVDLPGRLERRTSAASQSWEFMTEHFVGRTLHDTVYVSANPYTSRLDDDVFHAVVELFDEGWDETHETVMPETVVEATLAADERFPDKRLLVHFMQPHIPFIGERGRALQHTGLAHQDLDVTDGDGETRYPVWGNLRYGFTDLGRAAVWDAYCENLDVVVPYVRDLLARVPGKTVVTSDHGNLVGERLWPIPVRGYGHPAGVRAPSLVDVPWQVVPDDRRRDVRVDTPVARDRTADETVTDRLSKLGYTD